MLLFRQQVMSSSLQPHELQQARLPCPFTVSQSLLKFMSIELVYVNPNLPVYSSPTFLLGTINLFSTSMILFLFCKRSICTIILDSTYKQYHMIFIFLCLISLSVTISRSIHFPANDIISSFFYS